MKNFKLVLVLAALILGTTLLYAEKQDTAAVNLSDPGKITSVVKIDEHVLRLPGQWTEFYYEKSSRQHYYKNEDEIILAIAVNPMSIYPFYKPSKKAYNTVKDFFKWEYDYRIQSGFSCKKIRDVTDKNYILWKFNEKGIDNVFLYGAKDNLLVNYLIYTDKWDEEKKIQLLETIFELNEFTPNP